MTQQPPRVAIYWVPDAGSELERFGQTLFAQPPLNEAHPLFPGLDASTVAEAVKQPARYGLHATIKAPFRLKAGLSVENLQAELEAFTRRRKCRTSGSLRLTSGNRYITLIPTPPRFELEWLEAECVTHFDRFRAPLDEEDRARRSLDPGMVRERQYLEELGYPYVLSAFRFHITLMGPLSEPGFSRMLEALKPVVSAFEKPLVIRELALVGDPGHGGTFQVLSRHRFL